jgi:hypothetical protein
MTTTQTDRLVDDYLRRLEDAAAHLQRSRRAELVAEIREHIEAALRQEDAASEVAIRNVLERLGPPEEIVDAAEPPPSDGPARVGKLEIAALIVMVVPVLGWLFGVVLVLVSRAWSSRDKLVGVALALIPALVPIFTLLAGAESGSDELVPAGDDRPVGLKVEGDPDLGPFAVGALVLGFFAGLPSALYLGWQLRRHSTVPRESRAPRDPAMQSPERKGRQ